MPQGWIPGIHISVKPIMHCFLPCCIIPFLFPVWSLCSLACSTVVEYCLPFGCLQCKQLLEKLLRRTQHYTVRAVKKACNNNTSTNNASQGLSCLARGRYYRLRSWDLRLLQHVSVHQGLPVSLPEQLHNHTVNILYVLHRREDGRCCILLRLAHCLTTLPYNSKEDVKRCYRICKSIYSPRLPLPGGGRKAMRRSNGFSTCFSVHCCDTQRDLYWKEKVASTPQKGIYSSNVWMDSQRSWSFGSHVTVTPGTRYRNNQYLPCWMWHAYNIFHSASHCCSLSEVFCTNMAVKLRN